MVPSAGGKRNPSTARYPGYLRIRVPGEGVEPSRAEAHGILSPARLPVPPSRRGLHRLPGARGAIGAPRRPRHPVTLRARALAVLAATTAVATACTGGSVLDPSPTPTVDPVPVKVAFFQDGSVESPNTHGQPAFLGLKLALNQAVDAGGLPVLPELVGFDTKGDPAVAADLAQQVAEDPGYIAAVASPYWPDTAEVRDALAAAGVPTLSLSGGPADAGDPWFRIVAGQRSLAAALAGYVRGLRTGGGGVYGRRRLDVRRDDRVAPRARAPRRALDLRHGGPRPRPTRPVAAIAGAGCTTVVWTGFGTGAAELRDALTTGGEDVLMVGSDGMKDGTFLDLAGAAAQGTVVACACVDQSSSTSAAAQRFIHDYQSDYAVPPGVFAAEGWDAGGLLLRAMRSGAETRDAMLERLTSASPFEGLAATYAVDGHDTLSSRLAGPSVPSRRRAVGAAQVELGGAAAAHRRGAVGGLVPDRGAVRVPGRARPADRVRRRVRAGDREAPRPRAGVDADRVRGGDGARRGADVWTSSCRRRKGWCRARRPRGSSSAPGRRWWCRPRSPAPTTRSRRPGPATSWAWCPTGRSPRGPAGPSRSAGARLRRFHGDARSA